jgi:hypothetical protein
MSSSLHIREDSSAVVKPPLSQAVGYVVVVGIGLIIAFGMRPMVNQSLRLTWPRYGVCDPNSEKDCGRR